MTLPHIQLAHSDARKVGGQRTGDPGASKHEGRGEVATRRAHARQKVAMLQGARLRALTDAGPATPEVGWDSSGDAEPAVDLVETRLRRCQEHMVVRND